ncbi:MAG: YbbR-like domain-containing protein [Kofleriaceae bacterium]
MRGRSETIGTLGRAPARQSQQLPKGPQLPSAPVDPPPGDKGAIRRWLHGAFFDNVGLKFLSMVLAVTVFLLVNDDKDREITVRVGVGYVLPEDQVLVSDRLDEVRVTLRGPWRRLRHFDERELDRISVDLRNAPSGEITFTPDMIQVPAGLTVASITPRSMRVMFDKRSERLVEVAPAVVGRPQHGYHVTELKATPATVNVRGAQRLVSALSSVRTREIALDDRTESFATQVVLEPPEGIQIIGSDLVTVEVKLDQELVAKKLVDIPVHLAGEGIDASKWRVTPAQVEVMLTGPLLTVEKAKETLSLSIKVLPTDKTARAADVVVDGVPSGIGVRVSPERVKLAPVR